MPSQSLKSGFRLTQGDIEILTWVYQLRLSTIEHLVALTKRERTRVSRRLVRMLERKYLYRRRSTIYDKYVYTLNTQAIPILVEQGVAPAETIDSEVRRLREITDLFLKHALMLTGIHVVLELAGRESPIKLVEWREGDQLHDSVTFYEDSERVKLPVRPDAYFVLQDTRRPEVGNIRDFFLEADRSTTTNKRFQRKIRGYEAYYKNGLHIKKYGIKNALTVTVTRTEARAVNLCATSREVLPSGNARFYYFASMEHFSFENPEHVFDDIFMSPHALKTVRENGKEKIIPTRLYSFMPPLAK